MSLSAEAQAKFDKWHMRQRELGACRCAECKEAYPKLEHQPAMLVGLEHIGETPWCNCDPAAPFESKCAKCGKHQWQELKVEFVGMTNDPIAAFEAGNTIPHERGLRTFENKLGEIRCRTCGQGAERCDCSVHGVRLVEDTVIPLPGPVDEHARRIQHAIEENLRKEAEQNAFRMQLWERYHEATRRAKTGGGYERNEASLIEAEKRLDARDLALRQKEYETREIVSQADKARLSYEAARANLEREFGVETIDKAIKGLEKIMSFSKRLAMLESDAGCLRGTIDMAQDELGEVKQSLELAEQEAGKLEDGLAKLVRESKGEPVE